MPDDCTINKNYSSSIQFSTLPHSNEHWATAAHASLAKALAAALTRPRSPPLGRLAGRCCLFPILANLPASAQQTCCHTVCQPHWTCAYGLIFDLVFVMTAGVHWFQPHFSGGHLCASALSKAVRSSFSFLSSSQPVIARYATCDAIHSALFCTCLLTPTLLLIGFYQHCKHHFGSAGTVWI